MTGNRRGARRRRSGQPPRLFRQRLEGIRPMTAAGLLLAGLILALPATARAEWKAVEKELPYAIAGRSGPELYASIGERGPKAGVGRAIAYTDFKLTWTRNYERRGDACVLAAAKPKLDVVYRLPKPSKPLAPDVRREWETFIAGVRAHERVHGAGIVEMVKAIEAATVGLTVAGDPGCHKIRAEMTKRLAVLSLAQRRRSREFDRVETSPGGNVHRLVLRLVNGGAAPRP